MRIARNSPTKAEFENEILKYRPVILDYYKKGATLGELCRKFHLDISSILFLLKKSKLTKTKLYTIYEKQKENEKTLDVIHQKEDRLIEKFFPHSASTNLANSYFWYWREEFKKLQSEKNKCKHHVRHIRCSICDKILKDASDISLEDEVITKKLK